MADDLLIEIHEQHQLSIEVPGPTFLVEPEDGQPNVVALEVHSDRYVFEVGFLGDTHLDLMDGDLFVANDDALLGTRLREYLTVLSADANPLSYTIPASALRIFGFSINGIGYRERAVLTVGTGVVTLNPNGGYVPVAGDGIAILYSE